MLRHCDPSSSRNTPHGVKGWLAQLQHHVTALPPDGQRERLLDGLSLSLNHLLAENVGMAEELLCVYEQLGVVFEVSGRLPTLQHESAVVNLFVQNLQRSFSQHTVFASRRREDGEWVGGEPSIIREAWIRVLMDQCRQEHRVFVVPAPDALLASQSMSQAMVGPVFAGDVFVCAIVLVHGPGVTEFQASDMGLLEALTVFCGDLISNHRLVRELREMSVAMVRSLVSAVDQKDEYTSGHSLRVGYYAMLLGRKLGLSTTDLQMLQWGALLHDVGKIGIRDDVLKKAGKLTDEEFDHIKEHPVRSHQVVRGVPQLRDALAGVLHHHEHYDGSGYPSGLKGEDIPLQARIIQIADVFDALTSSRSYRGAYDWPQALEILEKEAGKTVDPTLQRVFDETVHQLLDDHPHRWELLFKQANQFTYTTTEDPFSTWPDGE